MTTRRQLERVIVHQAVCEKAAHDQADFFMRKLDNERATCDELRRERTSLLAENAELRADVEWLESVIHRLVDERLMWRETRRSAVRMRQSTLELEKAALIRELDSVRETSVDRAREIMNLRAELKRAKGRKR